MQPNHHFLTGLSILLIAGHYHHIHSYDYGLHYRPLVLNRLPTGPVSDFSSCCGEQCHALWRHLTLSAFHASLCSSFSGPALHLWDSQPKHRQPGSSEESTWLAATLNQWGWELQGKIPSLHPLVRQFWEEGCVFSEFLKPLLHMVTTSITYPFLLACLFLYTSWSLTLVSWHHFPNTPLTVRPWSQGLLSGEFNIK